MFVFYFMTALALATGFSNVAADLAPLNSNLQVRNAPGASSTDTLKLLHRSLSVAALKRDTDTVFKNSTSLDTSWDGTVLFSVSGYVHTVVETDSKPMYRTFLMFPQRNRKCAWQYNSLRWRRDCLYNMLH